MNSKLTKAALAFCASCTVAACTTNQIYEQDGDMKFGEASRQTLMAQVVNPNPEYSETRPASSAEHAQQAIERYRNDEVKQPEATQTSDFGEGGGSN